jgi:dihydrofolate reductase
MPLPVQACILLGGGAWPYPGRRAVVLTHDADATAAANPAPAAEDISFTSRDPVAVAEALRRGASARTAASGEPSSDGGAEGGAASATDSRAGDVWVIGGAGLAGQLLCGGAVDRVVVSVMPVILGGGVPLFAFRGTSFPVRLELERSKRFANGVLQNEYAVVR